MIRELWQQLQKKVKREDYINWDLIHPDRHWVSKNKDNMFFAHWYKPNRVNGEWTEDAQYGGDEVLGNEAVSYDPRTDLIYRRPGTNSICPASWHE